MEHSAPSKPSRSFLEDFLLGAVANFVAKTATHPIERGNAILQTQEKNPQIKTKFLGLGDFIFTTIQQEGFLSLWRGNSLHSIRYIQAQSTNLLLKDVIKPLNTYNPNVNPNKFIIASVLSGSFAGILTLVVANPIDVIRYRYSMDVGPNFQFSGISDTISRIWEKNGIQGFYAGYVPSVFGIVVYRASYFGFYECTKRHTRHSSILVKFLVAQGVVILAGLVSYPFDLIRKRLILQLGSDTQIYTGFIDCLLSIIKEEGFSGLFKGCFENTIRGIIGSFAMVLFDSLSSSILG
eukprot:TRINITY_DN4954_c0_g1_i1.p1 TRINITY_DN4954_c0_g1~~TRINITY_DN4954_c0_g1_i1.p1  ORF type:complete len:294 (+),score=28.63 TRINITY_DN4954_c0_g1_i1:113-994(+)